jgi:putative ABC transport system ATP-binding protein
VTVLKVEALEVRRGARAIISGISFHAERGEIVAIMGPSGAGKTTILRALAGLVRIAGGSVDVPRPVGMVFQFHHLFANMTAHKNVWLAPVHVLKRPLAEAEQRATELLAALGVGERSAAMPHELSGGEAQRVAIARALANSPRIVLADEPTASLDSARTLAVLDLLRKLAREQQAGVLIVTHDEQVVSRCDQIYQMSGGTIEGGSADDMYFNKFRRLRQRPDAAPASPPT